MSKYDVIVIGAGPAGLLAAGRAAELGGRVLVLEKMRQPGRKLLISGKGRCNVTNDAALSEFIKHVFPNGRFLKSAFGHFFSGDLIALLQSQGVEVTLERGGRYFPASNKSADVLQALLGWLTTLKVEIRTGHRVEKLIIEDETIKGLEANGQTFLAKNIVLATGGKSYPATGSNGEGYLLAKQAGHSLVSPRPALVPIETSGTLAQQLQGLTLKNVKAIVWINGKKAGEDFGEMLFTHFGLSGPIILTLSRIIVDALQQRHRVEVAVDLKPALDEQKLDLRLLRDLNEHGKKNFGNMLRSWLPASMVPVFIELLQIKPDKECHQVNAQERKKIRMLLKDFRLQVCNHRPFKEAIITAGGIPTAEIVSKTMESKLVKGLFFAGEIIDLDAETGGYNLQIAFSTGWLAGNSTHL
jgi:predicted Rossmann fold flavoprotein